MADNSKVVGNFISTRNLNALQTNLKQLVSIVDSIPTQWHTCQQKALALSRFQNMLDIINFMRSQPLTEKHMEGFRNAKI